MTKFRGPFSLFALLFWLIACSSSTPPPVSECYAGLLESSARSAPDLSQARILPGQLLVRYKDNAGLSSLAETRTSYGLELLSAGDTNRPERVRLKNGDLYTTLKALNTDPRVAYAEPIYLLETLTAPADPLYADQWHLRDFGLEEAWSIETGSSAVTLAIIDSGTDRDHQDLSNNMLPGFDFCSTFDPELGCTSTDNNPTPRDAINAHGTHVAGIAAANGGNGLGGAGVAYGGVRILPVKIANEEGTGINTSVLIDAILWAAGLEVRGIAPNPNPARVLNISLGGPAQSKAVEDAVQKACEAGAIIIAAAGNADSSQQASSGIYLPANLPGVIAVGSVNADYRRSSFSRYSPSAETVDIMAPGGMGKSPCGQIFSTIPDDDYGCLQGTSMASPYVAGVAALIWSKNPKLSAKQVVTKLLASTLYDADYMRKAEYGRGILCADRALGADTLCKR